MYDGAILKSGTSSEIMQDEKARRLYLGDRFNMNGPAGEAKEIREDSGGAAGE